MKRARVIKLGVCLFVSIFGACENSKDIISTNDGSLRGSGKLLTAERALPAFHSVNMSTAGQVLITQGENQRVVITVDDNLMDVIVTSVVNGFLVISIEQNTQVSNMDLSIAITMNEIEGLMTSSAGNIEGTNILRVDELDLTLASAGNMTLEIEANRLNSILASAGNLWVAGDVGYHHALITSAGNLFAFELMSDTTSVTANSAGNGEFRVTDFLEAVINSVGNIYYIGNPRISVTTTSLGRLIKTN